MGLFGFKKQRSKKTNSFGENLDRLTPDGDLPWGWYAKYEPTCKPYEDKIVGLAVAAKSMKGEEKIAQLEKLIDCYYTYKRFCYSNGECFTKYFSKKWEHCFNSRCKDFEYIAPYEKQLCELKSKSK